MFLYNQIQLYMNLCIYGMLAEKGNVFLYIQVLAIGQEHNSVLYYMLIKGSWILISS